MMEEQKRILETVFGESSEDSDDENQFSDFIHTQSEKNPNWERVKEINGLWLCPNFLSPDQQSSLLSSIKREGWFTEASHNQAMRFRDLPIWAIELAGFIREVVCPSEFFSELREDSTTSDQVQEEECPLPSDLLWREPLFDQLIVNVYQPGEGICGHVDLMRFDDGIAIISLESACVMHFLRVKREECSDENVEEEKDGSITKIPVLLSPGSLVLMSGEARYLWKHEINRKPGFQVWEGQEIQQKKRTSVTLRKLCQPK
ncbi:2-oxoglutarate (2OG) and Fe(II)-dependent oxygenase superfamily protein [Tasmannia lanceolata]|uniref:2-oxoglutarate (2OG) and Fe(II)-dependent oxygenase superfamily protein n=1 Tax=Tasmannia lanceolata TaxID=3420 RepID=UPI0040636408